MINLTKTQTSNSVIMTVLTKQLRKRMADFYFDYCGHKAEERLAILRNILEDSLVDIALQSSTLHLMQKAAMYALDNKPASEMFLHNSLCHMDSTEFAFVLACESSRKHLNA